MDYVPTVREAHFDRADDCRKSCLLFSRTVTLATIEAGFFALSFAEILSRGAAMSNEGLTPVTWLYY